MLKVKGFLQKIYLWIMQVFLHMIVYIEQKKYLEYKR